MKKILLVDDNADSRYALRLLLDDFDVLEASSGLEAIEAARTERPDCILLDVQMPGMDGFEVCRRLREPEETRAIPIVMVTAHYRGTESVVKGLVAGGDDYITKPVAQQELLARIRALLRIRELQDQLEVLNRELENQVRRRTEELRLIYATVPVGIYTLDARGVITSFNRALKEMLGYEPEEVVDKKGIGELFEPGYDTLYWLDICRREGHASGEAMAQHRDGRLIPVFDERVVRLDHVGERVGFTGYMQDVTQRRRVRAVLKEQETQAAIGRISDGIVHEIANPISGVAQYLDATLRRLERGETIPADELRHGAEVMRDAMHRTTDLIRHLRGFARSSTRSTGVVDPLVILDDIRTLMHYDLHRRGVQMVVQGTAGACLVRGDGGRLPQVFLNLITNARDAMPDGGKLSVEVTAKDSTVTIRFEDTGAGIPPADLDRIFDLMYTTKGDQGTGYGLAISQDIVTEHGGRIEVESEERRGTVFSVLLPQAPNGPPLAGRGA